jgi:2-dehydro-3-deoxyphosphogluconate aldolase/(4S)-4-hydroxy-2-oxoglutarate aldolase
MTDSDVVAAIAATRIVAVTTIHDAAVAEPVAAVLRAAGVTTIEVTFRTPAAVASIRAMAKVDEVVVGAGTVLTTGQIDDAVAAGARFVVTPGLRPALVDYCRSHNVAIFPGVATATELMAALEWGVDVVKFFPAESMGGTATLDALHGPFPSVRFIPTGGVSAANLVSYLECPNVLAVGGSWIVAPELLAAQNLPAIRDRARAAVGRARALGHR